MKHALREQLLERFEAAWRAGPPPALQSFLSAANLTDPAARRELLEELVKIDLDYHWRAAQVKSRSPAAGPVAPRLEDYLREHPELQAAVALISEEYRVRHRWGDRPSHAEYASRFSAHWPQLRGLLAQVDGELTDEFAQPQTETPCLSATGTSKAAPMTSLTAMHVVDLAQRFRLTSSLPPRDAAALTELPRRFPDPRLLARELIRRSWLTPYQVNQIFQGRAAELWLEPYVILERLGEGGMGQVFKARHVDMQRVVALKLIRKELLVDAEAVGRFRREVQVISQLTHAHVIHAYDAALARTPPFLVMEYVEGVSLGRLVEERGPLPAARACAYIRQAALGLQHIHERGLVHRDIKPGNLLLTPPDAGDDGVVKIMDLGLARLMNPPQRTAGDAATASGPVMMGTLDFMAPEQAIDFRQADIRSDIYSLGCTLWFLLAGRPPFQGTAAQKLLMHQIKEPPRLESIRPDLPHGLPAVVARMMAKDPAERMQTPAEAAALLAPFVPLGQAPLALVVHAGSVPAPSATPLPRNPGALVPFGARPVPVRHPDEVIVLDVRPASPAWRFERWRGRLPGRPARRLILAAAVGCVLVGLLGWLAGRTMVGPPEEVFLSDLPELNVVVRYKLGKNGHVSGGRTPGVPDLLSIQGRFTPKGLCTPPVDRGTARVSYRLDKQFHRFKAGIGLNDIFPESPTPLTFAVSGDGRILWQSLPVKKRGDEQEIDISVTGVELLELTVSCPGPSTGGPDGRNKAFPVWFQPRVIK